MNCLPAVRPASRAATISNAAYRLGHREMSQSTHWQQLLSLARREVEATLAALPAPVRRQAAPLPVSYEAHPEKNRLNDEYDPDLLGLFVGAALAAPDESPLPPQI